MEKIIYKNKEEFEDKKERFYFEGIDSLHVLADFDGTLTKLFVNGEKSPSIIAELRNGNYLDEDYQKRAHALFEKYHPYEIDSALNAEERKEKMKEWWNAHFDLLIEKGLSLEDVVSVSESGRVELREGIEEFFNFLHDKNVPLVIISASGIGEVIPMYLKKKGLMFDNVYVVSNFYEWDENGKAIRVKEPIVHSGNKDETTLKDLPIYLELIKRKNVLLLGNGINDLDMIKGFDYDNLVSIGFLGNFDEDKFKLFGENYDVTLLNDGGFDFVNCILRGFKLLCEED